MASYIPPKFLQNVKKVLGNDIKFLQHNDIQRDFLALDWHRDSVDSNFNLNGDWKTDEAYKIARVGIYLQSNERKKFRLGIILNSHIKKILH